MLGGSSRVGGARAGACERGVNQKGRHFLHTTKFKLTFRMRNRELPSEESVTLKSEKINMAGFGLLPPTADIDFGVMMPRPAGKSGTMIDHRLDRLDFE